ncbi:MAG: serine hydrolase domain-containing protein [Pseudomonadales bacterium]
MIKKAIVWLLNVPLLSYSLAVFSAEQIEDWVTELDAVAAEQWAVELFTSNLEADAYVGGVVSIVTRDQILYEGGFGFADYFNDVQADAFSTPFRSGSTSKVMTAIAIMQEVENRNIDLDQSVNDYLERVQIDESLGTVTVRHLLTHMGGHEERFRNTLMREVDSELATEDYLEKFKHHQVAPPGQRIQYSNYGMGILGVLLEDVTGLTFREHLTEHLFSNLGMSNSYIETPEGLPFDTIAREHAISSDGTINHQEFYYKAPAYLGSGGVFYTAHDMALFMQGVINQAPEVLQPATWEQMTSVQESENPYSGVGLDFWIYERDENHTIDHWNGITKYGHSGGTETFISKFLIYPKSGIGVFVATVGTAGRTYLGQPPFTATAAIDDFENRFRGAKDYQFSEQQLSDTEKFEGRYYTALPDRRAALPGVSRPAVPTVATKTPMPLFG